MRRTCLAVAAAWAAVVIGVAGQAAPGERFATWSVPSSFPLPRVPADNPLTPAKVAGRARLRAVARHPRVVEQMAPQLHERRDQTSRAATGRQTRGHIRIELEGDWPAVRDDVEPAVLAEQVGQKRGTIRGHPQSVLPGPSRVVLPGLRRHNSPASQRPPDVSRAYR